MASNTDPLAGLKFLNTTGGSAIPLSLTNATNWIDVSTLNGPQMLRAGQQYTVTYKFNPDTLQTEADIVPSFMESQYIPFGRNTTLVPGDSLNVSFRKDKAVPFNQILSVTATEQATYIGAWVHQVGDQFVATLVKEGER